VTLACRAEAKAQLKRRSGLRGSLGCTPGLTDASWHCKHDWLPILKITSVQSVQQCTQAMRMKEVL
jgi:hypothetical protein